MLRRALAALAPMCLVLLSAPLVQAEPPREIAGEYTGSASKPLGQHDDGAFKLVNVQGFIRFSGAQLRRSRDRTWFGGPAESGRLVLNLRATARSGLYVPPSRRWRR